MNCLTFFLSVTAGGFLAGWIIAYLGCWSARRQHNQYIAEREEEYRKDVKEQNRRNFREKNGFDVEEKQNSNNANNPTD